MLIDTDTAGHPQSWFAVALAREVEPGKVLGVDLLGTRVAVYRDPHGRPVVQNAWCPHLGADLSGGEIVDGQLRCPYHHWRFDADGMCRHIPTGDKIPPGARTFTYPTAVAWGLVWAFNGTAPLFDLPSIPDIAEHELVLETHFRGIRQVPPWVATSNAVDFQHLRALHHLPASEPDAIEVGDYGIEFRIETERYMQHGRITGVNAFVQHLRRDGIDSYMLFSGAPIDAQRSRAFFVIGVRPSGAGDAARLAALRGFVETLLGEDEPILNTMRFKPGVLVASDRHLARFFKYVREFPRAVPGME